MLSLISHVLSIHIPPLMFLLHLWLTLCLFYFFVDAPPTSLPISHSTLPSSVSSSESPPVVPDYT
jgi:hypothetical protein